MKTQPTFFNRAAWFAAVGWTALVVLSFLWNWRQERETAVVLALAEARGAWVKDVQFRRWATAHGGVYVPVTPQTQPEPSLDHLPDRDITTASGKTLTLLNPAHLVMGASEMGGVPHSLRERITSLNPMSPGNAADAWETNALRTLAGGAHEVSSLETLNGQPFLRVMKPMIIEAGCLKCHAAQGYKEDDLRGGFSIAVPFRPYQEIAQEELLPLALGHGMLGGLGLLGIRWGNRRLMSHLAERRASEERFRLFYENAPVAYHALDAEAALLESEARYRLITENASDWVFWLSEDGTFLYNSPSCQQVTGWPPEEFTRVPNLLEQLIHPDDLERWKAHRCHACGVQCLEEVELRIVRADGQVRWIQHFCQPVINAEGLFQGTRGSNRDITQRKEAEEKLRASEEHFRSLVEQPYDLVFRVDLEGRIEFVNIAAQTLIGYAPEELVGQPVFQVLAKSSLAQIAESFRRRRSGEMGTGPLVQEAQMRCKDGSEFAAELRSGPVLDANGQMRAVQGIVRDITQRKAHEREIERLTRLYAMLSQVNQSIVRVQSRQDLLEHVCRIAVEFGGFKLAWVDWLDRATGAVQLEARAGEDAGFLDRLAIPADEDAGGRDLVGTCIREQRPCVFNDLSNVPSALPWCRMALVHGLRAVAALPVRFQGEVCGAFTVCADEPAVFQDKELDLLKEMTLDISFALENVEREAQRNRAEAALVESEGRLLEAQRIAHVGSWERDLASGKVTWSAEMYHLFGLSPEEFEPTHERALEFVHPDDRERVAAEVAAKLAAGVTYDLEYRLCRPDGNQRHVQVIGYVQRDADGRPVRTRGTTQDITERKRAETRTAAFARLGLRLSAVQTARDAAEVVVQTADELFGWDSCHLHLYSKEEDRIRQLLHYDLINGRRTEFASSPDAEAPSLRARRTLEHGPQLELREPPFAFPADARPYGDKARPSASIMEVPIRDGTKAIGLISIQSYALHAYAPADLDTLQALADHCAGTLNRLEAEAAVRASEAELNRAQAVAHIGSWVLDLRSQALRWSAETYRLFGIAPGTPVTYETFVACVRPEDRAREDRAWQAALRGSPYDVEYRTLVGGQVKWVRERAELEYDTAGQAWRAFGTVQDITERKRAEEALRYSESLYQSLVENLPQNIFRKDLEGRFTFGNQRFCELLGRPLEDILGRTDADFFPDELAAKYHRDDRQVIETGQPLEIVEENRSPQQGSRWVQGVKVPWRDAQDRIIGVQGIFWDITERRRLEEQLRQTQKLESIGQLAAGVAHDFNNLLTVIQGQADLLVLELGGQPERLEMATEIIQASRRASNLTRQLLLFSRREKPQSRRLNLNELAQNLAKMLGRVLGEHVTLEFSYEPQLPFVQADPGMLEQVIVNLAVNARDAMPRGGRLRVTTSALDVSPARAQAHPGVRPGRFVCLAVSDTGCGIPPEIQDRVFDPFFTTKEAGKGTGLGLATVYGVVQQHSGWVEFDSAAGQGTTFRVLLPAAASAAAADPSDRLSTLPRGRDETILLVEDDPAVRALVRTVLARNGYQVILAESGVAALKLPASELKRVHLLLTDMVMPGGVSGRELADRLRKAFPGLRVVFYTGYSSEATGLQRDLEPWASFLQKPCEPAPLLRTLRDTLDRRV